MSYGLRQRFWVETGLALASAILVIVTLVWNDWIEIVFGVDPDAHSGSLEWLIVVASLATLATSVALAHREWQHRPAVSA